MLARLRRSRLALAALLALSPAGLGTILPVLHPCPVDAPWLTAHHQTAGHHAAHHDTGSPAATEHTCTCVGSCVSSAVPAVPVASVVARVNNAPSLLLRPSGDSRLELEPLASLLPPATAPPLV
jgi:hypothetical protein